MPAFDNSDENRQSAREQDPAPATLSTPTSFTEQQASVARCEDAAGAAASRRTVGDSCAYFLSSTVVVPAVLDDPEGQPMTTSERRHEEEGSLNLQQWHEADAAGSSGVRRVNGALSGGDNHGQERRHGAGREQAGGICVAKSGTDEAGSAKAWYDSTTAPAAGSGGEGAGGNHAAAAIVDRAAAGGSSSIVSSTKEIAASYNGHDPPSHFRTQQKGEEDREASSDVYPQEGADEALSPKPDPDITRNGSASPTRATSLTNAHHSNIFAGSTDIYSSERGTSINHASAGDYVETAKVRNLRNGGDREIEEQGNWVKGDGVVLDESKTGKKNTRSDDDIDEETSSFVKDDDGSGSDDEFGEAVVTHLGELQRQRSFEQHERVERRREMGVGIASVPSKSGVSASACSHMIVPFIISFHNAYGLSFCPMSSRADQLSNALHSKPFCVTPQHDIFRFLGTRKAASHLCIAVHVVTVVGRRKFEYTRSSFLTYTSRKDPCEDTAAVGGAQRGAGDDPGSRNGSYGGACSRRGGSRPRGATHTQQHF